MSDGNLDKKALRDARKTLLRYMEWAAPVKGRLAFRGQANAEWLLTAGAYRRLRKEMAAHPYAAHSLFVGYLYERTHEARMRFSNHGEKEALEIMAQLQHYGAATGLIDFTESALVALWFACGDPYEKTGKVFAIRLDDAEKIKEIRTRDGLQGALDVFFGTENPEKLFAWRPGDSNARMLTQQSLFVFGAPQVEGTFLALEPFAIPRNNKVTIKRILEESGISETFIFSDFSGFAEANSAEKKYDFHQTKFYYNEKIDGNERNPEFYFNRGNLNIALGQHEEGLMDFDKVIELEPGNASAHYNRGNTLNSLGRYNEAIAAFDKAIELEPGNAAAHINRGIVLRTLGRYDKAIAAYGKAIELDPGNAAAHNNRGNVLLALKKHDEACESWRKAHQLAKQTNDSEVAEKSARLLARYCQKT